MLDSIGGWRKPSQRASGTNQRAVLLAVALGLTAYLNGCAALERIPRSLADEFGARPVHALPGWRTETAAGLRDAIQAQCSKHITRSDWRRLCADPQLSLTKPFAGNSNVEDIAIKQWVSRRFHAWPVVGQSGSRAGLLTGYFEPIITGSRTRTQPGQVPLYGKPEQLVPGTPFMTRAQIDSALTPLAGTELVWLDDPVEAFFLHIQGSGRIRLNDGSWMRVGFAAHNGQPYHPIGRDLIEMGAVTRKQMSAQAIKQWLRKNPQQQSAIMHRNRRYIFFRELPGLRADQGPPGSLQIPLTRLRSVATDKRFVPAGSLLYLDSRIPVASKKQRVGLALSQDTGAAIKGQVRADLFTGSGQAAGDLAGKMREPLQMWLLWPKHSTPPLSAPIGRAVVNP